jgi:hypothetical protein
MSAFDRAMLTNKITLALHCAQLTKQRFMVLSKIHKIVAAQFPEITVDELKATIRNYGFFIDGKDVVHLKIRRRKIGIKRGDCLA